MKKLIMLGTIVFAIALSSCINTNKEDMTQIKHKTIQVEDCKIFYRETGDPQKPTLLLLHGFPSSSHMFRELMPELTDEFHLIVPDFPAFGQTELLSREEFTYSFNHLARIIDKFYGGYRIDEVRHVCLRL
ncbi:MAG: alpha/beta fold hydrolase [Bacteroidales bacterium]|nr:alpha/beta fold hydrolase [Bacteroidales bacterium]